ncbi:MAG: AMP-binding protein [Acidiferrobacterales bacterium]
MSTLTAADSREHTLLRIITEMDRELRPHERRATAVSLDSTLERDLGFDSLSRVELLSRIEHTFGVSLSEQVFTVAETPRDLVRLMADASSSGSAARVARTLSLEKLGEAQAAPAHAQTLPDVLEWHVREQPNRPHAFIVADDSDEEQLTYRALLRGAETVAGGLQAAGLDPGHTVAIMLPTGSDYLFTFFGTLLAGGIPVPIYPPTRLSQIEDHLRRHVGILVNAQARILVTVPQARGVGRLLKSHLGELHRVATVDELKSIGNAVVRPTSNGDDIAFIQYTSGSTADPKGVVLTHRNLLANIRVMGAVLEVDSTDVFVSWLPMYHDMGLIGAWLGSMYFAVPLVLMSPISFLTRPARWLTAIHQHRGTLSAAPNFAYELCLRKIDNNEIQGLDLSSWRMAANGAEPVSAETLEAFSRRFAPHGFRADAMYPVYGLAENSLGVAFPPLGRRPRIDRVQRDPLTREGKAIPAATDEPHALRFVGCGHAIPGHEIRILDATGTEAGDREEGRLQFRGPSATRGYFRNPQATRRLFDGKWLDSGDLGYTVDGEVYITGRVKDVIIRAGRNIYPQELEEAVGNIPGIRRGCVAVFPTTDARSGTERFVVLAESRESQPQVHAVLRGQINKVTVDLIGMPPDDIVLVPPRSVLKTSSGKLRRAASRELYERGKLERPERAGWWQIFRFAWTGMLPRMHRWRRHGTDLLYGAYVWTLFAMLALPTWSAMALLPKTPWPWEIFRAASRLIFRLSGTTLRVAGLSNLPRDGAFVLVANHSSYLDGLALTAILPQPLRYVAKRELETHFIARVVLRRLEVEYVERFDRQRGVDDARRVARVVRDGHALGFFPEGGFERMPGLRPFRMGAFVAAAEAGVPVVPVTIRGTRTKLRSDQWLPRRGPISVVIGKPIEPTGTNWSAAVTLRDAARAEILRRCGEPDLGPVDPTV